MWITELLKSRGLSGWPSLASERVVTKDLVCPGVADPCVGGPQSEELLPVFPVMFRIYRTDV